VWAAGSAELTREGAKCVVEPFALTCAQPGEELRLGGDMIGDGRIDASEARRRQRDEQAPTIRWIVTSFDEADAFQTVEPGRDAGRGEHECVREGGRRGDVRVAESAQRSEDVELGHLEIVLSEGALDGPARERHAAVEPSNGRHRAHIEIRPFVPPLGDEVVDDIGHVGIIGDFPSLSNSSISYSSTMNHLDASTVATIADTMTAAYRTPGTIDFGRLVPLLHTDVVLHVPGSHDLAGSYAGLDAIAGFIVASGAVTVGGEHVEYVDTLAGEHHVAVLVRVTGERADGRRLDNTTMHLAQIDTDGMVTDIRFHNRDQAHVDAFWG
jgi:uncharacterized protein